MEYNLYYKHNYKVNRISTNLNMRTWFSVNIICSGLFMRSQEVKVKVEVKVQLMWNQSQFCLLRPFVWLHSTCGKGDYRVIQRDCHKWKCYQITLNQDFIDFWGILRFHILGGLLFKATLNQSRHFWFLWPNFSYMIFFRPWNQLFCQATPTIPPFFGSRQTQFCGNISQFTPISW